MDERALYAAIAVVAGVLLGTLAGYLTRYLVLRRERSTKVEGVAAPAAASVFWVVLAIGIAVAVSILSPNALGPVSEKAFAYLPNVLVAILLLIVGRAAATVSSSLLGAGLAKATGRTRRQAVVGLRVTIMVVTVMLVLGQLGVNTVLLTIVAAALLFGTALALALLVGLGGRDVAQEVAAGRYLRRILTVGDRVESEEISGHVVTLHAATTEFRTHQSGTVHVPNSLLLARPINVEREQGD